MRAGSEPRAAVSAADARLRLPRLQRGSEELQRGSGLMSGHEGDRAGLTFHATRHDAVKAEEVAANSSAHPARPTRKVLILMDAKSATYKPGLLRALCRAADGSAGLAEDGDEHVRLPLSLVALNWLRLYLSLAKANLPQAPGNRRGADGLGFAGPGWQALAVGALSVVSAVLGEAAARVLHEALREAADHICRMPANYLTFLGGGRILETTRTRTAHLSSAVVVDGAFLFAFGSMRIPRQVWTAMQRFVVWVEVEPALISEWARLVQGYAVTQGRIVEAGAIAAAMTWSDPMRDVALPRTRTRALALMESGAAVHCVWSGRR